MNFIESFAAILGGTASAIALVGYLGRNLLQNFLKKDIEEFMSILRNREVEHKLDLEEAAELKKVVKKYSGIILLAASDLQDRLWHLCQRQSKSKKPVLLSENENSPMYGSWPMTKRHYLSSTLYLFARYFCWVEILRSNIRFLDFGDDKKTNEFNYHIKRIERTIAETDLQKFAKPRISTDRPLFQLLQTEIGESLITERNGEWQCMTFHDFLATFDEQLESSTGLAVLRDLLLGAMSSAKSNFCLARLRLTANALFDLIEFINDEHKLVTAEEIEKVAFPDFDQEAYEIKWPSSPNKGFGTFISL